MDWDVKNQTKKQTIKSIINSISLLSSPSKGPRVRSRLDPILSWRLIMEQFLRSFSSLPLNHSRMVVVSYKRKYAHEVLVNRLFKPAQEKVWLGEPIKQQNKQTNQSFNTYHLLTVITCNFYLASNVKNTLHTAAILNCGFIFPW